MFTDSDQSKSGVSTESGEEDACLGRKSLSKAARKHQAKKLREEKEAQAKISADISKSPPSQTPKVETTKAAKEKTKKAKADAAAAAKQKTEKFEKAKAKAQ